MVAASAVFTAASTYNISTHIYISKLYSICRMSPDSVVVVAAAVACVCLGLVLALAIWGAGQLRGRGTQPEGGVGAVW